MRIKQKGECNEKMEAMLEYAHDLAENNHPKIYNELVVYLNNHTPMSGDEALSIMTTFICHFTSAYIASMKKLVADRDDTGYTLSDLIDNVNKGIKAMLKR